MAVRVQVPPSAPIVRTKSPGDGAFFDFLTSPGKPAHCSRRQVAQCHKEPLDALTNNAQTARCIELNI